MWTLDLIDGTKGFLHEGQYAVCLALLVDARVELYSSPCADRAHTSLLSRSHPHQVVHRCHGGWTCLVLALGDLSFLESVEYAHAVLDTNARVSSRLGVRAAHVRMDSQAKYVALARGDGGGGVYLQLPVAGWGYKEKN
jgi:3'(2'), 5'-bisphosphate nucleotidase